MKCSVWMLELHIAFPYLDCLQVSGVVEDGFLLLLLLGPDRPLVVHPGLHVAEVRTLDAADHGVAGVASLTFVCGRKNVQKLTLITT